MSILLHKTHHETVKRCGEDHYFRLIWGHTVQVLKPQYD